MACAYAYAEGAGPQPGELNKLALIERFGCKAILGREVLGGAELQRMLLAERIVRSHFDRTNAEDWAAWAKEHPHDNDLLNEAMKLAHKMELMDG
jgi:hypothetical protein